MLLRSAKLTNVKEITFIELEYLLSISKEDLMNWEKVIEFIESVRENCAGSINFSILTFYELRHVFFHFIRFHLRETEWFTNKLLSYIKDNPSVLPKLKSIYINNQCWSLTNLNYVSIEKISARDEYYKVVNTNNNVSKLLYHNGYWDSSLGLFKGESEEKKKQK